MPVAGWLAAVAGAMAGRDRVGVAVSGGGDSLALLHLAVRVAPGRVQAVTVDHGLRPEAPAEAAGVALTCAGLDVPHDILRWTEGPQDTGNLMDQARAARRRLIADWAGARGIGLVLLGHTRDDEAETFVMNLARGTGLDGLVGLRGRWSDAGIDWARPLLGAGRAELRDWLRGEGIDWVDDPTNEDDRYARARVRKALAVLGRLGVTPARISDTAVALRGAQAVLREALSRAVRDCVREVAGALIIRRDGFVALAPELQRRLVIGALRWIGGGAHPPREAQVVGLIDRIIAGKDATLGGLRFRATGDTCTVTREGRACGPAVAPGQVWDGRWTVTGAKGEVRVLGPAGLRLCPDWRATGLPRQVLEVTPGVWQDDSLIAAPCAGFGRATATCSPGFVAFLLSH